MYLHANDKNAHKYEVKNLDTGENIEHCRWANDETGEYCVYALDSKGKIMIDPKNVKKLITNKFIGNIKIVRSY